MWGKGLCVSIWFSQRHSLMNLSWPHCLHQFQRLSILMLWSTCLFYEGTILFWPPWLCNVSWIQEYDPSSWFLCLALLWLFPAFCGSVWILGFFSLPAKHAPGSGALWPLPMRERVGFWWRKIQTTLGDNREFRVGLGESETLSQNQAKTKVQMLLKFLELYGIDGSPSLVWTFNQY